MNKIGCAAWQAFIAAKRFLGRNPEFAKIAHNEIKIKHPHHGIIQTN